MSVFQPIRYILRRVKTFANIHLPLVSTRHKRANLHIDHQSLEQLTREMPIFTIDHHFLKYQTQGELIFSIDHLPAFKASDRGEPIFAIDQFLKMTQ